MTKDPADDPGLLRDTSEVYADLTYGHQLARAFFDKAQDNNVRRQGRASRRSTIPSHPRARGRSMTPNLHSHPDRRALIA